MIPLIVLGLIIGLPILLALIFRVNAIFVFLSICAGYFLQFALSDDFDLAFATVVRGADSIIVARLVLLFLPLLLTLFLVRKSQGKSLILQIMPLIFSGLFLAIITLPLLPSGTEGAIYDDPIGGNLRQAGDLIMAAAIVSNLILVWMLHKPPKNHRKHH